jgi:hypothetical protein
MKRSFLSFFLIIVFNFYSKAQIASSFSIYAPVDFPKEILSDYINLLNNATSKQWQAASQEKEVNSGIILKIATDPSFKTKESFHLQSNGKTLLLISSSSNEGLIFGFYKHLRSLGFKFYLPDELYTITPTVTNPFGPRKNIYDKPFLQVRNFFGTGGFGTNNPDPDKSVEKGWNLWRYRNGFGVSYQLAGHSGENFIMENKEKLRQNPQWLASPLSGNMQEDMTIKLNYLNNDALNFFVDWTLQPFTKSNYKLPPPNHTEFVSIEPSDGSGYLNDLPENKNKKLPSISDQVYGAANLAAEKLDKLFPNHPNIGVNLYAYSSHAAPPSFPLHPRVFVQLIPYQFQNIAFGPSFIKLWAEKVKRFGIYDYFRYPDAQFDVPGGISLIETMKRLIHSVKSGSEGTHYETSYSKFSTGIPLWVIGRYLADGDADWKKNLDLLCKDLYKNSSGPINDLFGLFYKEPSFSMSYLGNAVAFVDKASQSERDEQAQKRILELKKYLQFIHLVNQLRNVKAGSLKDRSLPLIEYAWKLYETKIIHSYRIIQLISYSFLNVDKSEKDYALYQQLHIDWFPETERSKSAWNKIPQIISPAEVENNFQSLKKLYPVSNPSQSYTFSELKQSLTGKLQPKKELVISGDQLSRGYFGFMSEKPAEIKIRYSLTSGTLPPKISLSGIDNNYTSPIAFNLDKPNGELKFTLPAGETSLFINASEGTTYRMQINIDNGLFFFDGAPRGPIAFYRKFSDPANLYTYEPPFYPSYIYFPKDAQTIEYKVQLNALSITSPSGKHPVSKVIQTENSGVETRTFSINQAESGKLWKAVITGNYNYNFINIPDRYFLLEEK